MKSNLNNIANNNVIKVPTNRGKQIDAKTLNTTLNTVITRVIKQDLTILSGLTELERGDTLITVYIDNTYPDSKPNYTAFRIMNMGDVERECEAVDVNYLYQANNVEDFMPAKILLPTEIAKMDGNVNKLMICKIKSIIAECEAVKQVLPMEEEYEPLDS